MPEKKTIERARKDAREGKAPTTQAGEFVREEIEHVRKGQHGARSPKQIIAIGLSKARRAGIDLPPPAPGKTSRASRKKAGQDYAKRKSASSAKPSPKRSRASKQALRHESGDLLHKGRASHSALSKPGRSAARKRKTDD
jgi:hypothetical protein